MSDQPAAKKAQPRGGSRKGVPNRVTRALRDAILGAAEDIGEDGKGRDGLTGYLRTLARAEPKAFAGLLGRVLPTQIQAEVTVRPEDRPVHEVLAEVNALLGRDYDDPDGASTTGGSALEKGLPH